ncbi:MAG: hypothetical protein MJD61_22430 [Proteobacteria bacterium]|nr:hypothetical protein [Pseudomonadota bacterium]
MINAGDAASGSTRTEELVYRDGVYYELSVADHAQFPLNSIFNHEPKKTSSGEPANVFRNYLYMHMSRGAMLVEYYLKTAALQASDWDALAETTKWAHEFTPAFARVRMHGGDPRKGQVYGYAGFSDRLAYVSFHNPAQTAQPYTLALDRSLGAPAAPTRFVLSSPVQGSLAGLPRCLMTGAPITLMLAPKEIRLLELRAATGPAQCN